MVKKNWMLIVFSLAVLFTAVVLAGCGKDKSDGGAVITPPDFTAIDGGYAGTDTCLYCHDGVKASDKRSFKQSGHPYKYTHIGGVAPASTLIPSLFTRPGATNTDYLNTLSMNGLMVADSSNLLDWSVINYTIGGYGWKIRWGVKDNVKTGGTDSTGFVWAGNKAQYNIRDGSWSKYPATVPADKKYECAICHNTNGAVFTSGYSCYTDPTTTAGSRTQPWAKNAGMTATGSHGGYYSQWTFDGVQCEACHGPGETHAKSYSTKQNVLTLAGGTVEICAKCHIRAENTTGVGAECGGDADSRVLTNGAVASGSTPTTEFISHHEQYNEMVGLIVEDNTAVGGDDDGVCESGETCKQDGAHAGHKCTTCHDPHKRTTKVVSSVATLLGITDNNDSGETRGAIKVSCTSCHAGYKSSGSGSTMSSLACIDCHMAEATKSATGKSGTWGVKGDVKTHIFRISTSPTVTTILRKNADGKTIATNYLTYRYACGKCHDTSIGGTVNISEDAVKTKAVNYHGTK